MGRCGCDLQWLKAGHDALALVMQLRPDPVPRLTGPQILIGSSVDHPLGQALRSSRP